jgi:hypothetical protein
MQKRKKIMHLLQLESITFVIMLYILFVKRGISNTPCLMQTKGKSPKINKMKILKTYPPE